MTFISVIAEGGGGCKKAICRRFFGRVREEVGGKNNESRGKTVGKTHRDGKSTKNPLLGEIAQPRKDVAEFGKNRGAGR